jgi:hypothetical protein
VTNPDPVQNTINELGQKMPAVMSSLSPDEQRLLGLIFQAGGQALVYDGRPVPLATLLSTKDPLRIGAPAGVTGTPSTATPSTATPSTGTSLTNTARPADMTIHGTITFHDRGQNSDNTPRSGEPPDPSDI